MELKALFAIIAFVSFVYFFFGGGSRLLKKKSHHYIVPPDPQKDRNWIPIDFEAYKKEIYIDKTNIKRSAEQITALLTYNEFQEEDEEDEEEDFDDKEIQVVDLDQESPKKSQVDFELKEVSNWMIIEFIKTDFYSFHDTIWLFDDHFNTEVIGLCQHPSDKSKDYVVRFDRESEEAHLIGAFRNERNFGIYMPKADKDKRGNISASSVQEVSFARTAYKLPS